MDGSPPWHVTDAIWAAAAPLIPEVRRRERHPGRRRLYTDRDALQGILYVGWHDIHWSELPWDIGSGAGITCWRRLRAWRDAGAWPAIYRAIVAASPQLRSADLRRICP